MTEGDIAIATDCAGVLRRAQFLQSCHLEWDRTYVLENPVLWDLFLQVAKAHNGDVKFVEVKAHTPKEVHCRVHFSLREMRRSML